MHGKANGGVLIGVNKSVPSRLYLKGENTELIAVELLTNPSVILCCIYILPNCSTDYCINLNSLNTLPTSSNLIVLGDFNSPDINLSGTSDFSSKLCDFIFEKNLTQLVNVPTHN